MGLPFAGPVPKSQAAVAWGWAEAAGCGPEQGLRGPGASAMSRHSIFVGTVVFGLACAQVQAEEAAATIGISARVNSFAEWCEGETPASVTTAAGGRSLRIAKALTLFANTDVSLTLAPQLNGGVLTAGDGDTLHTSVALTGDGELADRPEHGGTGKLYRVRHVPGRGAYALTLDVRASLPAGRVVQTARSATSIRPAGQNTQRIDAIFEVNASEKGPLESKAYRCGFSITVSW